MAISAAMIKTLRERTGAGMMDCKRYLQKTDGDMEAAIKAMREDGQAKADKKAARVAAEGLVVAQLSGSEAVLIEVNSETDFVARNEAFKQFVNQIAALALKNQASNLATLMSLPCGEHASVDAARQHLVLSLGENIQVRRCVHWQTDATFASYQHGDRIAVLVEFEGGDESVGRSVAMQVAAMKPLAVDADGVAPDVLSQEEALLRKQSEDSGKPPEIVEKMLQGRMKKYLAEVTLLGQSFVKDDSMTVGTYVKQHGVKVRRFLRFEVGEGVEKDEKDFAQEVMEQLKGRT